MTWLWPPALVIAGMSAVAAAALHLIARGRPRAEPLPTARFVPLRHLHDRARAVAWSDLPLLALRVLALIAIGVAVAAPVASPHGVVERIVLVDRSRAVASTAELHDSLRALVRGGDLVIPFDSVASVRAATDSISTTDARGALSAGLAAAIRAAAVAATRADSMELVIVSPLAREEFDEATSRLRGAWPGRVRVVMLRSSASEPVPAQIEIRAQPNDAVAAALSLLPQSRLRGTVRILRSRVGSADSAWARLAGHVLVVWPASDTAADWARRVAIDAIGAVTASTATLVARFPRPWILDGAAVARWADGEPAAVERATGGGCIREVGILVDESSDLALRTPFRRFVEQLLAPCGGARAPTPASAADISVLAGRGVLAPAVAFRGSNVERSPATPWLLALGAAMLVAELALRRPRDRAA
ncbi:MAG TPA: hypothetical protein VII52_00865 [Gemmatimonadaceae bacterium]